MAEDFLQNRNVLFIGVMYGHQYCMEVKHGAERDRDGNFMKDREIHGERNVWWTVQRWKKNYKFDVGFE